MSFKPSYNLLDDYLQSQRSYTIRTTKSPTTMEFIAKATVNGHQFEARHKDAGRAAQKLSEVIRDAEQAGQTQPKAPEGPKAPPYPPV